MKIELTNKIDRPVGQAWNALANDFDKISDWASFVVTSTAVTDHAPIEGAPMAGRYCTLTPNPDGFAALEAITRYDEHEHRLGWDVEFQKPPTGMPLRRNHTEVVLREIGTAQTEATWTYSLELKAHGYAPYPALSIGLKKSFRDAANQFKAFVEGQPVQ